MIILMQHGEAFSKAEDPERPLNPTGLTNVKKIASLSKLMKVDVVCHSDKLRARQSAEIMANALFVPCRERTDLGPNSELTEELLNLDSSLVVGHLPHLDRFLSQLVTGDPESSPVSFRNAAAICIEERKIQWILWPEMVVRAAQV